MRIEPRHASRLAGTTISPMSSVLRPQTGPNSGLLAITHPKSAPVVGPRIVLPTAASPKAPKEIPPAKVTARNFIIPTSGFIFQLRSQDVQTYSITFLDAQIEGYDHQISSTEEAFSRPFARARNAQSVDAPAENYTFPDLLLDTRYRNMGTAESGGKPPDIEAIINKIRGFMEPNLIRMRKHRLSVRWGSKIIGKPPVDYLYLNSLSVKGEQYDDLGNYVTARLSMSATLYAFQ